MECRSSTRAHALQLPSVVIQEPGPECSAAEVDLLFRCCQIASLSQRLLVVSGATAVLHECNIVSADCSKWLTRAGDRQTDMQQALGLAVRVQ
jgi:hypothetical protein